MYILPAAKPASEALFWERPRLRLSETVCAGVALFLPRQMGFS